MYVIPSFLSMRLQEEHWDGIPERSRLYPLSPIGIATPAVESLTDYVMRLAQAHTVSVRYLLSEEIYYSESEASLVKWFNWMAQASSINGLGPEPLRFVELLRKKMLRQDLSFLTFLPYKGVFSQKALLRSGRAWCSACLEEMRGPKSTVYEKLVWAIECVSCCPRHNVNLDYACPSCRKLQRILSANSVPGHCNACMKWLGSPGAKPGVRPSEYELWIARSVEQIVAASPRVDAEAVIASYREGVMQRARELTGGSVRALSRGAINYGQHLNRFGAGNTVPLGVLLKSAFELQLPIDSLLVGEDSFAKATSLPDLAPGSSVVVGHPNYCASVRRDIMEREINAPSPRSPRELATELGYQGTAQLWRADRALYAQLVAQSRKAGEGTKPKVPSRNARETVKRALERALEHADPPTVTTIAMSLGYRSAAVLRRWFRADCIAITAKRTKVKAATITAALTTARAENPPPTLEQVAKRSGYSVAVLSKVAPELCKQLDTRRRIHSQEQREQLRESVLPFLNETPPPTGAGISSRLGISEGLLRLRIPDLWSTIRKQSEIHQAEKKTQSQEALLDQIRRAVDHLLSAGEYPSLSRIARVLGKTSWGWVQMNTARRKVLDELEESSSSTVLLSWQRTKKKAVGAE